MDHLIKIFLDKMDKRNHMLRQILDIVARKQGEPVEEVVKKMVLDNEALRTSLESSDFNNAMFYLVAGRSRVAKDAIRRLWEIRGNKPGNG